LPSHAALRLALATYRGTPAHELAFETGSGGVRSSLGPAGHHRFGSTSPTLRAYLPSRSRDAWPAGLMPERLSTHAVDDSLLSAILSPFELARLGTLARNEATAAFHRLWTRKEAVLKALGSGLKGRPALRIGRRRGRACVRERSNRRTPLQNRLAMRTFQPTPDHVLSVAIGSVTEALRPLLD